MNGQYVARGREVLRSPKQTERGFKMGFIVCTVHAGLNDDAAQEIADALNLHMQQHPEQH